MTRYLRALGDRIPGGVALGLSIIAATVILSTTAIQKQDEAKVAVDNASSIAGPVSQLCARDDELAALLHSARTPDGRPVCDQASVVLSSPTAVLAVAKPVTDAHITSLIRAELAKTTPRTNGAVPSLSQVTDAVRNVMTANPVLFKGEKGDPGGQPSSAEIAQVVSAYIRANPEQFQGKPGKDGRDGQPGRDGRDGAECKNGVAQQQVQVAGYIMWACVVGTVPETTTDEPQPTVTRTVTPTPTEAPPTSSPSSGPASETQGSLAPS